MNAMNQPSQKEMMSAFMGADSSYDGIFYSGVRTTGIFCRPSCTARKPKPENIEFFPNARDALFAGYRPCKRCHPLQAPGHMPAALQALVKAVDGEPQRRWRDQDLRAMDLNPATVRRWFQRVHGMTFHGYARARRLGLALDQIRQGSDVTATAFDHGFESLSGFGEAVRKLTGHPPGRSRGSSSVVLRRILSPMGPMLAGSVDDQVVLLEFTDRRMLERQLRTLEAELKAYFDGRLTSFSVPVNALGTEFQQQVWMALTKIPSGKTVSYQQLATQIGRPAAVRAVARANGDNRLAILVPCHRVIGKDGTLTGYGGGLWRKQRLLEIEGAWPAQP
jgi:AraC family transcriptional regulator of adaptative response/methylated-DNA-[protein]-cysteine methyltransferase